MSRTLTLVLLPTIVGCDHDIGLHYTDKTQPLYADTAAPLLDVDETYDTAWSDTGTPVEEPNDEPPAGPDPEPDTDSDGGQEPPTDDCDNTSDLIYAIDANTDGLYLFNPQSNQFQHLGVIDCGMFVTPESMSVSRNGVAYVRSGNEVYAVDVETLDCTETTYDTPGFGSFGMGFSTLSANTWQEALFIANGSTLARLDLQTWEISTVGNLPSQSELTGNASGELWAFFPLEQPAQLSRISSTTAQIESSIQLPQFPSPYDIDTFAFATWDGSFYLFVRTYGMGSSTDVYRVELNGSMTRVVEDSGLNIVGAGVSTCAPE